MLAPLLGLALATFALPVTGDATVPVVEDSVRADAVQVRVVNHNWLDMRIYAVVNGRSLRLGTVTGLTSETLKIRESLVGFGADLGLVARGIGSRSEIYRTSILVSPGDVLEFRIENSIRLSYVRRI
jgi:hypothetical protein